MGENPYEYNMRRQRAQHKEAWLWLPLLVKRSQAWFISQGIHSVTLGDLQEYWGSLQIQVSIGRASAWHKPKRSLWIRTVSNPGNGTSGHLYSRGTCAEPRNVCRAKSTCKRVQSSGACAEPSWGPRMWLQSPEVADVRDLTWGTVLKQVDSSQKRGEPSKGLPGVKVRL
jgi:hypothetical protein